MFLGMAKKFGFYEAAFLASRFEWNIERPLKVLEIAGVKVMPLDFR